MGQVLCWNEHFGLISNLYDKKNPLISVETDAEYGQDQNCFFAMHCIMKALDNYCLILIKAYICKKLIPT